jgi:hypothetical protein
VVRVLVQYCGCTNGRRLLGVLFVALAVRGRTVAILACNVMCGRVWLFESCAWVCRDGMVGRCVVGVGFGGMVNVSCVSWRFRCGDGGVVSLCNPVVVVMMGLITRGAASLCLAHGLGGCGSSAWGRCCCDRSCRACVCSCCGRVPVAELIVGSCCCCLRARRGLVG